MIRSLTMKLVMLAGLLGFIMALNWSEATYRSTSTIAADPSSTTVFQKVASNSIPPHTSVFSELPGPPISKESIGATHQIDLNQSTARELESLPGIGTVLAQRIIDHRIQIGGFSSIQALKQVKGIGKKKLQMISPLVKISSYTVVRK